MIYEQRGEAKIRYKQLDTTGMNLLTGQVILQKFLGGNFVIVSFVYCHCHRLDDTKESEDEVRDDPQYEANDGP